MKYYYYFSKVPSLRLKRIKSEGRRRDEITRLVWSRQLHKQL